MQEYACKQPFAFEWALVQICAVSEITKLLGDLRQGDPLAADSLLALVYEELRKMAALKMAREQPGHTLQPTALAHEAWVRLTSGAPPAFKNRAHFFSAAGEAMRRILVESARRKNAVKRDVRLLEANLETLEQESSDDEHLLTLNEALEILAREDPLSADLVKLRYFTGLTMQQAADALDIPLRRAERLWTYARAWLRRRMHSSES